MFAIRGRPSEDQVRKCNPRRAADGTGRARYDFHRHSVEIFFSERSIGNPQSYDWGNVATLVGGSQADAFDALPNGGPPIRHQLAVPALASQTVKIDSKVTLAHHGADCNSNGNCSAIAYHGRVKSRKHACEVQRTVKVFKQFSGRDRLWRNGKDKTNNHGRWRVWSRSDPGFYYAKVLRREVGTAGTICRADRSKVFDLH